MKTLKISLAVLVVAAMGTGVFFWLQNIHTPGGIKPPENPFTKKIEQEIEQLKALPDNKFCKDFYKQIAFHIEDFYKPLPPKYPYGRYGGTQSANDQWKKNLESNLYSAYAEKFIQQAFYVLRGNEWRPEDLKFIQAEKTYLKSSKLLVPDSPVDHDFKDIQNALNKYNEIVSFVSSCRSYSFTRTELAARFPVNDVKSKLARAASLMKNKLENGFTNNCTRLHNDLKGIPLVFFNKHVGYLDNKIDYWSNMWCNYSSHRDYSQNLNTPLRNEINEFGNSEIYSGINLDSQYNRLLQKWAADNQKAYNANYPCK